MLGERYVVSSVIHAVCFDFTPTASQTSRLFIRFSGVIQLVSVIISMYMSYRIYIVLEDARKNSNDSNEATRYKIQRNLLYQGVTTLVISVSGMAIPSLFLVMTGFGTPETRYHPILPALFCIMINFHSVYNPLVVCFFDQKVRTYIDSYRGFSDEELRLRRESRTAAPRTPVATPPKIMLLDRLNNDRLVGHANLVVRPSMMATEIVTASSVVRFPNVECNNDLFRLERHHLPLW